MPVKRSVKRKPKLSMQVQEAIASSIEVETSSLTNKLKQRKFFIGLIVVILLVGAFFLKGLFVAALVNGEPIMRLTVLSELEKQGGKQTLTSLVNQTLILQEAKKKNIEISQSEIDASLKQIEDSLKSQGQNLDTVLAMQGMKKQDLITQLKLRVLVEKLLADKIKVTDKEVAEYIETNRDTLPTDMKEDEIKKSVTEQLKQQKLATESQTWLDELAKNAKINYFVNY